ncbi:MAG: hypothetical protein SFX74_00565 [Fimbriimonadaceae bacterium]|nr:hypothetical protein [Fimbriimonadaceae bacterium]
MSRAVLTLAVGKRKFAEQALGLGRSLRLIGDPTPRVVVTDMLDLDWAPAFDHVVPYQGDLRMIFFDKLIGLEATDANEILFIDADMLAFRPLEPIFRAAAGCDFAVQGQWISDGDWYTNVAELCRRYHVPSIVQLNGGMIYYRRTPEFAAFRNTLREMADRATEIGVARDDPLIPDEPIIGLAMAQTGFGRVWPEDSDFHNSATGLIGQLRLNVRRGECGFLCRRYTVRYVEPILFHASRYSNFLIYWRQLATLHRLETYEKSRPYGYLSPWHKLSRSVQRRLVKWVYRP